MSLNIHPSAVIEQGAQLADGVEIGPFCHVGSRVSLGANVKLRSHAVVDGRTTIGEGTEVFPFAAVGTPPQDLKFRGEESSIEIGRHCKIREHVTVHPGTEGGGGLTRIGDNCLLMVGAHVAHDCLIGNHVILVNNATLGGHVEVDDFVIIGGVSAVHQFVRIGKHAFVGGQTGVEHDIIPYGSAIGNRAELGGLNITGLRRHQFPREDIHAIRRAYRMLFGATGNLKDRAEELAQEFAGNANVMRMIDFVRADSKRGFTTPRDKQQLEAGDEEQN